MNRSQYFSPIQDGKKLTTTENMEITYQRGVCRLHIKSVTIQDEAEYTLEARNEYGIATSVCELLVESKRKQKTSRVAVAKHVSSLMPLCGPSASIRCV